MSRNKCFPNVRISHVLHFMSICDLFTDSPLCISDILTVPLGTSIDFQAYGFKKHYRTLFNTLLPPLCM
jgi:hypothetical protein